MVGAAVRIGDGYYERFMELRGEEGGGDPKKH